ncbi:winged helix-turn-helix domain-containing protein [Enterococcus hulanensis]|uniref:Winged helix-turn-helix domain-containing protein n=1 Tax=Enterococcus hulanensis TaxID=2559929 RepID=A0ABU3F6B1_9ENTE|nr:winged helix-turn-helix domain-containing protein [Enterococcus hulanensis]MDT2601681.1 winged helix-turn-helix domain-containing protein [Enterococcus hulanensis]MDT2609177.1 winged helix-turn-helix domain-containing protein [Enterococcus hulanensis]MDT2616782.1 winged helix-turn-helix domain-containing protein [Enterococcus hulanensis]MDT2629507.1 winged helix-turn-helix domain-containing protein [Enterococcus hulanensis]MDT2657178.1 winged helix-turn-helix domain-containing protein [Ente
MAKILIITKNPLAEQELQLGLQKVNDEVFCTSSLLEQIDFYPEVAGYFSIAILSDTISSLEMSKYLSSLKRKGLLLLRKGAKDQLKETDLDWMIPEIDEWFTDQTSMEEFIEKIARLKEQIGELKSDVSKTYKKFISRLTKNERKVVYYLYKANGSQLSREELCEKIWGTGVNTSNVCQLSFLVSCIREKMINVGFDENELKTMWGRGYQLGDTLVSLLNKNEFSLNL